MSFWVVPRSLVRGTPWASAFERYIDQRTLAGALIVIDVLTDPTSIPSKRRSMSSWDETATPHVPNSPFASGRSSGVYSRFTIRLDVVVNSARRSGIEARAFRRVVDSHRLRRSLSAFRPSDSAMSRPGGFKLGSLFDRCANDSRSPVESRAEVPRRVSRQFSAPSTIVFARPWKASSTFAPFFADV